MKRLGLFLLLILPLGCGPKPATPPANDTSAIESGDATTVQVSVDDLNLRC